ncbi:hypothetical protein ACIG3E_32980 [Streptomyces sp. NPDC053474]|uniref:hypothetical protein n=1 Tax=Streptomyces sp. NPDC053474 TaxID=3365704 RepID=UPI0037D68B47
MSSAVARGQAAVDDYRAANRNNEEEDVALQDLLADLMLWCRSRAMDWDAALESAESYAEDEELDLTTR